MEERSLKICRNGRVLGLGEEIVLLQLGENTPLHPAETEFLGGKPIDQFFKTTKSFGPPLYFKTLRVPNPMSLSKFQCILHDSALYFSVFKNFLKLKRRCVISWRPRGGGGTVKPTLQCKTAHLFAASLYFNFKD